jgi:hypothetical protein
VTPSEHMDRAEELLTMVENAIKDPWPGWLGVADVIALARAHIALAAEKEGGRSG